MFQDLDTTLTAVLSDPAIPAPLAALRAADKSFLTPDKTFGQALPNPTVNLFLYEVNENRQLRENEPIIEKSGNGYVQRPPPLRVDCCYLVTTWAIQPGQPANVTQEHSLLGQALTWLSRFREIPAPYFRGAMVNQVYPPQVWVGQLDTHKNTAEFWFALGIPPRPAFHLTVTVSLDLLQQEQGALVTTTSADHLQSGQANSREGVVRQIGGQVLSPARALAVGSAIVNNVAGVKVTVNNAGVFSVGDLITKTGAARAQILQIQGNTLTLDTTLPALANTNSIRIANLVPGQLTFRVTNPAELAPGMIGFLTGDDAANPGHSIRQRVTLKSVDFITGAITLNDGDERFATYNLDPAAPIAAEFVPATSGAIVMLQGVSPPVISSLNLQTTCGSDGHYIFERLPEGRYRLRAEAAGLNPIPPSEIEVPSQTGTYDLQFT